MGQKQSSNQINSGITDYNNRSNQLNHNNIAYWKARGHSERPDDWANRGIGLPRGNDNNRANQLNPNNPSYVLSRSGSQRKETGGTQVATSNSNFDLNNVVTWVQTGIQLYFIIGACCRAFGELYTSIRRSREERRAQRIRNN